ncbi:MAG TPA: 5'-nucleotidase C-terminal domain-containing protein [Candidatus Limnocylindria bacterium]|nr:5'-nucleotidase C-terminal domain-containing protein [Candidatus Limnocylindria bacterium]
MAPLAAGAATQSTSGVPACVRATCVGLRGEPSRLCKRICRCQGRTASRCPIPARITLLHYNDLHAHLMPHLDLVRDADPGTPAAETRIVERGGLARLATVVQRARAENPNTLLLNVGDTYHGGVEALYTNGNAIVAPVNALGVDVGVPGNWDFAYGPLVTRARYGETPTADVARPTFANLGGNATYAAPDPRAGQPFLPATLLKEIAGIRVGFVGITSDIVRYMHPVLASGLSFLEGEESYRQYVNTHARALREQGAAVVVVMSELGIQKDYRLAHVIDPGSVDVFFSAHTHEAVFTPLRSRSGALVVEAGNDGYLGRMDMLVAEGLVAGRRWQLTPIGTDIPEDEAMRALVAGARAPFLASDVHLSVPNPLVVQLLDRPIDTVIGHTDGPLDRRQALESAFNNAFADLLRGRAATQVAITPGFRFDAVVPSPGTLLEGEAVAMGAITVEDAYRFFPVVYSLATGEITGARLREILEEALADVYSHDQRRRCLWRGDPTKPLRRGCERPFLDAVPDQPFRQRGGWMLGLSGIGVTLDLTQPDGARILTLHLTDSGTQIDAQTTLTVAGCVRPLDAADQLCSYPGVMNVRPLTNPTTGRAWTPVDVLVDVLALGPAPAATRRALVDVSESAAWPVTPFVQPLTGPGEGRRLSRSTSAMKGRGQ